ncbi:MAG: RdgB/HAM1 family non-canonical purine NTP pyrophosphatase [Candidatus Marinimicrobia bacterium]|nr:RdgB/HAM1 family non-canonical purine NTP pyrophosphatase [Candidatus Neomarinimicrobiota bacterium]
MKIVLATHNQDKCREMTSILSDFPIDLLTLDSFPEIGEIIEDGNTLEDNALIKARTVFKKTNIPSWADDTGLEVDAIDGEPGIYSARYAGENCSYSDNVNKLIENMLTVPSNKRTAQFKTAIAFVGENMELVSEGTVEGLIATEPKGVGGFGYDPVFYIPEKEKTYSEMSMKEKNKISHRGKAIQNMIFLLRSRLPHIFHQMEDIA